MKNPCREHSKRQAADAGFTLIELLTVIAIISILAGLTAVAVPNYLNKAKQTKTIANMDQVAKGVSEYSTRTENRAGYPPAYGYIKNESKDVDVSALTDADHVLEPYTIKIGTQGADNTYQILGFADSFDCNHDGALSLFEYLPIGAKSAATGNYEFSTTLYDGANTPRSPEPGGLDEVPEQLSGDHARPYVYIPFNKRQLDAVRRYWLNDSVRDAFGASYDASLDARLFFPPAQYDGFVVIGNGPGGDDGGLLSVAPPGTPGTDYDARYTYHMLGLRIAFLATRDLDPDYDSGPEQPDGLLDFSYEDRKQSERINQFPNGSNGQGPFIKVVQ